MHELALCQALIDQVQAVALDHPGATVTNLWVSVGPLSGVEPALLEHAFLVARAGGPAAEAKLFIEAIGVRVRCHSCGSETDTVPTRLICGSCGDFHIDLVQGDELVLRRVELLRSDTRPRTVIGEDKHV